MATRNSTTKTKHMSLSEENEEMLRRYRKLDEIGKAFFLLLIHLMTEDQGTDRNRAKDYMDQLKAIKNKEEAQAFLLKTILDIDIPLKEKKAIFVHHPKIKKLLAAG